MSPTRVETPVRDALEGAVGALTAAGVDSPRLDAELLLAEAVGTDRAQLATNPDAGVPASAARTFGAMVRRRVRREPVAYILGRKGFRNIEVAVDRRVLIPRPETELLVEVALELEPSLVLDIGTGSGAVALAIADELPEADVVATDTSEDALEVARGNADRIGIGDRVRFAAGTIPDGESFEVVVANLPYVSESEWEGLEPEIRDFEPRDALVAGPTGLEALEALVASLDAANPPGAIAHEVGAGQAPTVAELLRCAGYEETNARTDLAGIERVVVGRR